MPYSLPLSFTKGKFHVLSKFQTKIFVIRLFFSFQSYHFNFMDPPLKLLFWVALLFCLLTFNFQFSNGSTQVESLHAQRFLSQGNVKQSCLPHSKSYLV